MNTLRGTRTTVLHEGKNVTLKYLSEKTGISLWVLYQRYRRGDREQRLIRPALPRIKYNSEG